MLSKLFRHLSHKMAPRRIFAGPVGQRIYAVGDIHGRLDLLDEILRQIEEDLRNAPINTAAVVFLGDLIDRGPDSASVIERLCNPGPFPAKMFFLLGNHEEVLLRVLAAEPGTVYEWLKFGGGACVESYGLPAVALQAMDEKRIAEMLAAAMPVAHIEFLKSFGDTFRFGDFLLVHAGIRPGVPIEEQELTDLRWIRDRFLSDEHDHGVMVIHGHTVTDGVDRRVNRIGIDTGAYRTGILTAAVIEGVNIRFLYTCG